MKLTLEDLQNIREALNEKIAAIVNDKNGNAGRVNKALEYAATRDKVQTEIERAYAKQDASN